MIPTSWQQHISPLQYAFLKRAWLIGGILFFIGVQLTVRGKGNIGGWLSAFGMFVAAELFWGLKKLYDWIEQKRPRWIEKWGYQKLFWILIVVGFIINMIGFVSLFFLTTNFISNYFYNK